MNRFFQKMMMALACLTVVAVLGTNTITAEAAPRVLGSQPAGATATEQPADNDAEQPADDAEQPADTDVQEENTAAALIGNGTVTADSVRVRADATTSSDVVGNAAQGTAVAVTGEKSDSEGNVWYAVSFESDGETITGYIRSDLMSYEAIEVVPEEPEAPAEEIPAEETPVEEVPADDYYVEYMDDGTGISDWYLFDQMMGRHYKVSDLLSAQEISAGNQEAMEKQVSTLRAIIVILAVVVLALIGVVTFFIIKLRSVSEGYEYDEDEDDEEDEEEEEEEEEPARPRRGFFARRRADEEDEDEEDDEDDEEEEERPVRRASARRSAGIRSSRRYEEEEEEDEDEEEEYQPRRSQKSSRGQKDKNWQSKNFLDDDDLEFEFLDLK